MDLMVFSPDDFRSFILILLRVSVVLFMFPFLGGTMVPMTVKAGLALMISVALFPVVRPDPTLFPDGLLSSVNVILSELVLGLIVGLTAKMFFAAVQLAGQLIGFQMGFSIAGAFDPESGSQGSVLAEMGYWIAIVLFLLLNGHHIFLRALTDSFTAVEVGSLQLGEGLFRTMLEASRQMFVMSLKVGAPAVVALLFTSASFGIVAKVVPQMNILIVAFPLKVVVGLFFFGFSVEMLLFLVRQYVANFEGMLGVIMKLMKV